MNKCENDSWDKVFPKSEKVSHEKVTFVNRFGITLVADLYDGGEGNYIPFEYLAQFYNENLK